MLAFSLTAGAAVNSGFLSDDSIADADPAVIKAEAQLFEDLREGVLLNLAECEVAETCSPSVTVDEVERILNRIDVRITQLSTRYTETSDPVLEEALLVYADARKGYAEVLDKLQVLEGEDEGDLGEDEFGKSTGEDVDFSDLFKDTDKEP